MTKYYMEASLQCFTMENTNLSNKEGPNSYILKLRAAYLLACLIVPLSSNYIVTLSSWINVVTFS